MSKAPRIKPIQLSAGEIGLLHEALRQLQDRYAYDENGRPGWVECEALYNKLDSLLPASTPTQSRTLLQWAIKTAQYYAKNGRSYAIWRYFANGEYTVLPADVQPGRGYIYIGVWPGAVDK